MDATSEPILSWFFEKIWIIHVKFPSLTTQLNRKPDASISMIASQTKMDRSHKICGVLRRAKQSHIMLNLGRYRLDLASDNLSNLDQNRLPCGLSTFKCISNRQIFHHTAWPTIPWPDPTTKSWDPMVSIPKHSLMFLILVMVDQWSSCYIKRFFANLGQGYWLTTTSRPRVKPPLQWWRWNLLVLEGCRSIMYPSTGGSVIEGKREVAKKKVNMQLGTGRVIDQLTTRVHCLDYCS